jgi:hypothetical protein
MIFLVLTIEGWGRLKVRAFLNFPDLHLMLRNHRIFAEPLCCLGNEFDPKMGSEMWHHKSDWAYRDVWKEDTEVVKHNEAVLGERWRLLCLFNQVVKLQACLQSFLKLLVVGVCFQCELMQLSRWRRTTPKTELLHSLNSEFNLF